MASFDEQSNLKLSDGLRLLWDEYSFRQGHYWRSNNRFVLSIITLSVVPYVQQSVVDTLGPVGLGIISISCMFSFVAAWLLHAEYIRLMSVREALDRNLPDQFRRKKFEQLMGKPAGLSRHMRAVLWYPIGGVTSAVFLVGFGLITHLNLLIYSHYKMRHSWVGAAGVLLAMIAFEILLCVVCASIAKSSDRGPAR